MHKVSTFSQKGELLRGLMKIGCMKGERIVMHVCSALQKLRFIFFQGHRLNRDTVFWNAEALCQTRLELGWTHSGWFQSNGLLITTEELFFAHPHQPACIRAGPYWVCHCWPRTHVPWNLRMWFSLNIEPRQM